MFRIYTIKFNDDKTLTTTVKTTVYQNESKADSFLFLLPPEYGEIAFSDCTLILSYLLPGFSDERYVTLAVQPELYKGFLQYTAPITRHMTAISGKMRIWLTALDLDNNNKIILKSGESEVSIIPAKNVPPAVLPPVEPEGGVTTITGSPVVITSLDTGVYNIAGTWKVTDDDTEKDTPADDLFYVEKRLDGHHITRVTANGITKIYCPTGGLATDIIYQSYGTIDEIEDELWGDI